MTYDIRLGYSVKNDWKKKKEKKKTKPKIHENLEVSPCIEFCKWYTKRFESSMTREIFMEEMVERSEFEIWVLSRCSG